ncbi:DNA cytosine methyltransferase [Bacillus sp. T33-2]|uniref:DNA cytosine methyltransferase n=1 Tax=Bacillus sp. T33-2 TaxID=2054168 RepID=UPI000C779B83|nr:DNA cytosine methyltransferase [Bacillus sp. T33-2]PLR98236.1 DNA (cytosine-5-)-methyltransferase [Bacillus sp. T33-2]
MKSVEICAGAGGQALGLAIAGFHHVALVENDKNACETLRYNRPEWNVLEQNLEDFKGEPYKGVELLAGGVPCQPFSNAGLQLGSEDERDLIPEALRLVAEIKPKAVMLENVKGLLDKKFEDYRQYILWQLEQLGYIGEWRLINSSDYGVPQTRPRSILIVMKPEIFKHFQWPENVGDQSSTVGETLVDLMGANGWKQAKEWAVKANGIAPTIVGGSKKHGGADLGPTGAKKRWVVLGVDGKGIANEAPDQDFEGMPRLTNNMVARIQGFPDSWRFAGKKTPAYRQIGNAFPPPVAQALGVQIKNAILKAEQLKKSKRKVLFKHDQQTKTFRVRVGT